MHPGSRQNAGLQAPQVAVNVICYALAMLVTHSRRKLAPVMSMTKAWLPAATLICLFATRCPALIDGVRVDKEGSLHVGEVEILIRHFAPGWKSAAQGPGTVQVDDGSAGSDRWWIAGRYLIAAAGESFQFTESLQKQTAQAMTYEASLRSATGIPTQQLALEVLLPVKSYIGIPLQFDDRRFVLPEQVFNNTVVEPALKRLVIPTRRGKLVFDGNLDMQIQDGRLFADKRHFRLRLLFQPSSGLIRESRLAFTLRLQPYASAADRPPFPEPKPVFVEAGKHWQPIEHHVFTKPGSILDWSSMVDAPAGKYGRVVVRNGHFEFERRPGEPVRFYGINLCDRANFQDKAACEKLAAQFARMGYNSIRIHHYDRHLPKPGQPLSAGFDAANLDKLDYLFYCLKQHGLYMTIDLYTVRKVLKGEIAEINRDVYLNEFKALVPVSRSAMDNWKLFARLLLTHVNPYTGLAWKDDPALYSICLLNEDDTTATWDAAPDIARLYRARFAEWQRTQKPEVTSSGDKGWARFLIETHLKMLDECSRYLRSLGVKALLTDANYRQDIALGLIRQRLDYVDNHDYLDLKQFLAGPWQLPYGYRQTCATRARAQLPRSLFAARQFGKPYTVTEFNYCYPNHYRAEGGALMGAYAALQDWDGVYRYAYAHAPERTQQASSIFYLDNAGDPINLLADRIGILLFRRRDVAVAPTAVPYIFSDQCLNGPNPLQRPQGFVPDAFTLLGLRQKIGSLPITAWQQSGGAYPVAVSDESMSGEVPKGDTLLNGGAALVDELKATGAAPKTFSDAADATFMSETGQIRLHPSQSQLTVTTERTECFVVDGDATVAGHAVRVHNRGGFAVICVSAMDGQPIPQSKRLLVFHLTDVQNTKVRFEDEQHTVLESWGGLPHLVRRGDADVQIGFAAALPAKIWAVGLDGARCSEVAHDQQNGKLQFAAQTISPQGTFLVYEIERG